MPNENNPLTELFMSKNLIDRYKNTKHAYTYSRLQRDKDQSTIQIGHTNNRHTSINVAIKQAFIADNEAITGMQ